MSGVHRSPRFKKRRFNFGNVIVVGPVWGIFQALLLVLDTVFMIATITPSGFPYGLPSLGMLVGLGLTFGLSFLAGYVIGEVPRAVKALLLSQTIAYGTFIIVLFGTLSSAISGTDIGDFVSSVIMGYVFVLLILTFISGVAGSVIGSFLADLRHT